VSLDGESRPRWKKWGRRWQDAMRRDGVSKGSAVMFFFAYSPLFSKYLSYGYLSTLSTPSLPSRSRRFSLNLDVCTYQIVSTYI
jgi:hypothetical protein